MAFPITPLIDFFNSLLCAYCSYHLYLSFRRERSNRLLLYFSQAYLVLVFSYLFFSLPRLIVPSQSFYLGVSFVIAQAFLYLALAFFAKVTTSLLSPRWPPRVFFLILAMSLVAVVLSIIYFGYPRYDVATGTTDWDIQPVVGVVSTVIFAVTLVPSAFFFLWQGHKSQNNTVRIRSFIIGSGLLLLIVTAYTYYTATTAAAALVSDLISLCAYLVIFVGVAYRRGATTLTVTTTT